MPVPGCVLELLWCIVAHRYKHICCFSDLLPLSSTKHWFHCLVFSRTVLDCDCELHTRKTLSSLTYSPALHFIKLVYCESSKCTLYNVLFWQVEGVFTFFCSCCFIWPKFHKMNAQCLLKWCIWASYDGQKVFIALDDLLPTVRSGNVNVMCFYCHQFKSTFHKPAIISYCRVERPSRQCAAVRTHLRINSQQVLCKKRKRVETRL